MALFGRFLPLMTGSDRPIAACREGENEFFVTLRRFGLGYLVKVDVKSRHKDGNAITAESIHSSDAPLYWSSSLKAKG